MGEGDHEIPNGEKAVRWCIDQKSEKHQKLMERRLKRVFLLVDATHGLKRTDREVLSEFRKYAIPHQVILSKVDRLLFKKADPSVALLKRNSQLLDGCVGRLKLQIQPGLGDGPEALGEVLACSATKTLNGKKLGINNVRWAVLAATGLSNTGELQQSEIAREDTSSGDGTDILPPFTALNANSNPASRFVESSRTEQKPEPEPKFRKVRYSNDDAKLSTRS